MFDKNLFVVITRYLSYRAVAPSNKTRTEVFLFVGISYTTFLKELPLDWNFCTTILLNSKNSILSLQKAAVQT